MHHSAAVGKTGSKLAIFSGLFSPSTALVQPVAIAVHFEDMNVVRQTIEERTGEALGTKISVRSSHGRFEVTKIEPRS